MHCTYSEEYHVFIGKSFADRTIILSCKEGNITLPDAEILIIKQNSPTLCRANEIGDDMEIVCLYKRTPLSLDTILDKNAVIDTMSLYKEYAEETEDLTTYLY